jgi:hypothetical protein
MVLPLMAAAGPAASSAGSVGAGAMAAGAGSTGIMSSLGGILGGAGMLAGGLGGMFGGSKDAKSVYRGKHHKKAIKNELKTRLKYAQIYGKKFGIHPLVAMGINPSNGPSVVMGENPNMGRAFERMGQGLQKFTNSMSPQEAAEMDYLNSAAELNRARARSLITGQSNTTTVSEVPKKVQIVPDQQTAAAGPGVTAGSHPFFNFANRPDGSVQVFPAQKFQESTSEGFHAIEYLAKMAKDYAAGLSFNLMNTPKAMMARNELRNQQRVVEKVHGGKWAYDPFARAWYRTNTNALFNHPRLRKFTRKYEYGSGKLVPSHKREGINRRTVDRMNKILQKGGY